MDAVGVVVVKISEDVSGSDVDVNNVLSVDVFGVDVIVSDVDCGDEVKGCGVDLVVELV